MTTLEPSLQEPLLPLKPFPYEPYPFIQPQSPCIKLKAYHCNFMQSNGYKSSSNYYGLQRTAALCIPLYELLRLWAIFRRTVPIKK